MSMTATGLCFYCSNPINPNGRKIYAGIRHHYKHGGTHESDRNFHPACFSKFEAQGGRPWNPETEYEILHSEEIEAAGVEGGK